MAGMTHSACSEGRDDSGCLTSRLPSDPGTGGTNLGERGQRIASPPKFPQHRVCFLYNFAIQQNTPPPEQEMQNQEPKMA